MLAWHSSHLCGSEKFIFTSGNLMGHSFGLSSIMVRYVDGQGLQFPWMGRTSYRSIRRTLDLMSIALR
jgi:hypothetical protein